MSPTPRQPALALSLVLPVLLVACGGGDGSDEGAADADAGALDTAAVTGQPDQLNFAPELGVDLSEMTRTESGLYYRMKEEGSGATASTGDTVVVHYTGWLADGRTFDSSRERGEPTTFPLTQGGLIAGWVEGVSGMKEGGRKLLVLPPDLAYGAQGSGPIPPNAVLVFDVELLEVR